MSPAPTAAASLAGGPHRQTGLVRAGGLQGEPGCCWQLLKGLFVTRGLAVGSCPTRVEDSLAFVPTCCSCPDPGSTGQWPLSA
jgi:hypothetical protein